MAKFTTKSDERVTNYMGGKAFKEDEKMELVTLLLTSFYESSYYESKSDMASRLTGLVKEIKDKKFVAKAAIYARTTFGMRSISHAVAGEIAHMVKGEQWSKNFFDKIVHRVDDMMEILAYYHSHYKKNEPNALLKGFRKAFGRFDEYQLSKYKKEGSDLSLVDLVNMVHPAHSEALAKLIKGELKPANTWETKLSKAGKVAKDDSEKAELKKEVWADLIRSKKIGYMALVKNLRNILQQSPEIADQACELLTDRAMIKSSLILPFRFVSAYQEVEKIKGGVFELEKVKTDNVLKAIEKAIEISIENIPTFPGRTVILSDNSGSMTGDSGGGSLVSAMSNVTTSTIGNLFSAMYWTKANNTLVGVFGDRLLYPKMDRTKGLFDNFKEVDSLKHTCGGATEMGIFTMFERLVGENIQADRIVIFSDCQIGTGCEWYDHNGRRANDFNKLFAAYKRINPRVKVYSINLKGYGNTVFSEEAIKISGWSEKIFDLMKFAEQDKNALINEIERIEL